MKTIIKLSIFIFILGCADGEKKEAIISNNIDQIDTLQTEQLIEREFAICERDIGYDNDRYIFRTTPFLHPLTNEYTVEILLKGESDTVYMKTINKDTLLKYIQVLIKLNREREIQFRDTIEIEEFIEYNLVDVISTSGIRGYKSYLYAMFSKESSKDILVRFELKAFPFDGKIGVRSYGYFNNTEYLDRIKGELKTAHNT